jgi:hypothetical protein
MGLDLQHLKPIHQSKNEETLEYLSLHELSQSPDYLIRNVDYLVDKEFDVDDIKKVIYFHQVGYQRKGMKGSFYKDFKNDGLYFDYFDLESLHRAYSYLEADHISTLSELQQNFQKNFIDNFIVGESIFEISW